MIKRVKFLFLFFLLTGLVAQAQVHGFEYSPNQLKRFKRIISLSTNPADSLTDSTIYLINNYGRISKRESFSNGKLYEWEKHTYSINGQTTAIELHQQTYVYDKTLKDHVPVWLKDHYSLTTYEYRDGKVLIEKKYDISEGKRTLNEMVKYEYDKKGRKIKVVNLNFYKGLVGVFEQNTANLKSLYNKSEAEKTETTYRYSRNLIEEKDIDKNGEIKYISLITLNKDNKPIEVKFLDKDKKVITINTFEYNKDGNLYLQKRQIIDRSKYKFDDSFDMDYIITYNEEKMPKQTLSKSQNKVLSKEDIIYK